MSLRRGLNHIFQDPPLALIGVNFHKRKGIMSNHRGRFLALYVSLGLATLIASAGSHAAASPQPAPIEPNAGTWPTWLLASGSELRPPAAPDEAATLAELPAVQALAAQRDHASTRLALMAIAAADSAPAEVITWARGLATSGPLGWRTRARSRTRSMRPATQRAPPARPVMWW